MKGILLKESELVNLIRRVINEQSQGPCKRLHLQSCDGGGSTMTTDLTNCNTVNGSVPNNSHMNQVVDVSATWQQQGIYTPNNNPLFRIVQVEDISSTAMQPTTTIDYTTSSDPCGSAQWGTCNKDCNQLVPSSFAGLIANKPCNWLNNRWTAFTNKLNTLTQGSCQYKRVECKRQMLKPLRQQNGC